MCRQIFKCLHILMAKKTYFAPRARNTDKSQVGLSIVYCDFCYTSAEVYHVYWYCFVLKNASEKKCPFGYVLHSASKKMERKKSLPKKHLQSKYCLWPCLTAFELYDDNRITTILRSWDAYNRVELCTVSTAIFISFIFWYFIIFLLVKVTGGHVVCNMKYKHNNQSLVVIIDCH